MGSRRSCPPPPDVDRLAPGWAKRVVRVFRQSYLEVSYRDGSLTSAAIHGSNPQLVRTISVVAVEPFRVAISILRGQPRVQPACYRDTSMAWAEAISVLASVPRFQAWESRVIAGARSIVLPIDRAQLTSKWSRRAQGSVRSRRRDARLISHVSRTLVKLPMLWIRQSQHATRRPCRSTR